MEKKEIMKEYRKLISDEEYLSFENHWRKKGKQLEYFKDIACDKSKPLPSRETAFLACCKRLKQYPVSALIEDYLDKDRGLTNNYKKVAEEFGMLEEVENFVKEKVNKDTFQYSSDMADICLPSKERTYYDSLSYGRDTEKLLSLNGVKEETVMLGREGSEFRRYVGYPSVKYINAEDCLTGKSEIFAYPKEFHKDIAKMFLEDDKKYRISGGRMEIVGYKDKKPIILINDKSTDFGRADHQQVSKSLREGGIEAILIFEDVRGNSELI